MKNYIIGIDLGGTNIKFAIYDLHLNELLERTAATEAEQGPAHVLGRITSHVLDMMNGLGILQDQILAMGIGVPGLLDPEQGLSIFSPNFPGWEQIEVVHILQQAFDFPIFIDNDVRVNLYGEWLYGAGQGFRNAVLITIGTGLGAAVVHDGRMMYGTTSSAGEIGHMNMYREGRPCRCGSSGCLGRYVSALGMIRTFKEKVEQGKSSPLAKHLGDQLDLLTAARISEAYDQGDPLAVEVMEETGTLLGFGLTNVINLLNPEIIIVGGGVSAAGERLLAPTRKIVQSRALAVPGKACQIVTGALGSNAGRIGAAAYAMKRNANK
ncbi:ROK family protein [Paenibacillus pinistramenti]|uniref:ROK family protein n=1 Tax=Paenibacillus pinistramenti TaxID=1768003 RepID=UPI001108E723|nr:ROK family protein [Paenibacillus pinistramenti]